MRVSIIILSALFYLASFTVSAQIPEKNRIIKDFVGTMIGKKVGTGECWDLAQQALEQADAVWDGLYVFGEEVDPEKDTIYPGDIIQFEKVTLKYIEDNSTITESYPHHTAIVYEILGPGKYRIAHQNNGFSGRKVGLSVLRLADIKSGKIFFYRPVAEIKK